MSELINTQRGRNNCRYHLLATVSSAALLTSFMLAWDADAAEDGRPTVWIAVGGALDQMDAGDARWLPPNLTPPQANPPPGPFGKMPAIGHDEDLSVSFSPDESDWIYSASIRYGRAQNGPKHSHDQTYKFTVITTYSVPFKYNLTNHDFANSIQKSHSAHAILDFQAGKDVGLGMFGRGTSVLSAGVRVVKLNENASGHLTAFVSAPAKYSPGEVGHKADFKVSHSFNGLGPSVSWDGATPLVGTLREGFTFDWGANAALLFGKQKSNVSLLTGDTRYFATHQTALTHSTHTPARDKTVIVPNVGGFAGVSWRLSNAKISLGYRADFFFGAVDGGLLTSQKETRGFYGPFANVSVGIGG